MTMIEFALPDQPKVCTVKITRSSDDKLVISRGSHLICRANEMIE
jgi:hypothetical protein